MASVADSFLLFLEPDQVQGGRNKLDILVCTRVEVGRGEFSNKARIKWAVFAGGGSSGQAKLEGPGQQK